MALASNDLAHLTQRELEQALWAAANALRGPVDPGDFKAYVFPVMFFKWISDARTCRARRVGRGHRRRGDPVPDVPVLG